MQGQYIPKCLRDLPKVRKKPRNQAIREAKAEIINEAIVMMRDCLRKAKLGELPIHWERGYLSAISRLEQLRDEIK